MSTETLFYTSDHEWISVEGDKATVGVTDYAAEQLGDIVYVELPDAGTEVSAGTVVGEIESTKSVGELFAPIDGTVSERNEAVIDDPSTVNSDPFGAGWLIKIRFTELPADLLDEPGYNSMIGRK